MSAHRADAPLEVGVTTFAELTPDPATGVAPDAAPGRGHAPRIPGVQRVVVDHDFSLPPARVFAYLAEHEHLGPLFGAKIRRLRDGTDGTPNGVGSVRELKVGPLPPFQETVTEVIPDELIRYRITKGSPLRGHEGTMRFTPSGTGTHLHYEIAFRAVVPGLDRVIAPGLKRTVAKNLGLVDRSA